MECMFLLIGAHQHVQVKAFRLALATLDAAGRRVELPFLHSSIPPFLHSQPEELQPLGE